MTTSDDLARPLASADADHHRARRRERARQETVRQRRCLAGLVLVVVSAAGALWISGISGGSSAARPGDVHVNAPRSVAVRTGAAHRVSVRAAAPSPGSLPQTHTYPSGSSVRLESLMASLWTGIVHDSLAPAMAAFFPKDAYVRLKAIGSAGSDWTDRLVHDYGLDIAAAHMLLGRGAAQARLIAVHVPSSYGHWIQPGVCYNSIGYYEMPGARLVYRENGETHSFGIASMISWRGVWYVVHLGAILRSTDSGTVDEPASGPGSSAYSGTC